MPLDGDCTGHEGAGEESSPTPDTPEEVSSPSTEAAEGEAKPEKDGPGGPAGEKATLEGSEKQVAWAEDIRSAAHDRIDEYQGAAGDLLKEHGPEAAPILDRAMERIETEADASWWIDHKALGSDLPGLTAKRMGRERDKKAGISDAKDILFSIALEEMDAMQREGGSR